MSTWSPPMAGTVESAAPSLGPSDDSTTDSRSFGPDTPCDVSPRVLAQAACLMPHCSMDVMSLPQRYGTPQPSPFGAVLPDILDPESAAYKPIRSVCCIGAGYVGAIWPTQTLFAATCSGLMMLFDV